MSRPDLDRLRETLLRGGIAPKHVRRYIAELQDHAADLAHAGIAEGLTKTDAEREAWITLGSEDALTSKMLQRIELQSLGARYPVPFYGAGPTAALFLSYGIAVLIMAACISALNMTIGKAAIISLDSLHKIGDYYCWFVRNALPILVGLVFAAAAIRQRANPNWLIIGIIFISFIGASADMSVIPPPDMGSPGELQFGFGVSSPPFPELGPSLQRGLINLALIAPALAWLWVIRHRAGPDFKPPINL